MKIDPFYLIVAVCIAIAAGLMFIAIKSSNDFVSRQESDARTCVAKGNLWVQYADQRYACMVPGGK